MKELSIEEKSRRYDEAIERAKSKINNDKDHVLYEDDVIEIFPELKESEDEKIRKELIEYIKDQQSSFISAPDCRDEYEEEENNKYNSWIAWLEKQCEQNPAWSEEDKKMSRFIGNAITADGASEYLGSKGIQAIDVQVWLEKLKDRMQQPKQVERKGEEMLNLIIARLHSHPNVDLEEYSKEYDWLNYNLKSLRPQKQWKPSEEQMDALNDVISSRDIKYDVLSELWKDLKKLKEE